MIRIYGELDSFLEQRPCVQAIPSLSERTGNRKLHFTALQRLNHCSRRAPVDLEMDTRVGSKELGERRNQKRNVDAVGNGDVERRDVTALHGLGQ